MNKKLKDILFQNKVVILFILLCVGATIASKQPLTFVIPELFTRIARNSFIVLSLIIPVIAGMGLNFGIVIGAMSAQIALFLTTYWGLTGFGGFLVTAALVYFIPLGLAPAWVVILILAREFLVTSLRLIAAGKGIVIAADKWGKYKTATTMVWICYALLAQNFYPQMSVDAGGIVAIIHLVLMTLSLALTLISGANYLWKNRALIAQAK